MWNTAYNTHALVIISVVNQTLSTQAPILMTKLDSEFNRLAAGIVRMKSVDLTVRFVATWPNAVI